MYAIRSYYGPEIVGYFDHAGLRLFGVDPVCDGYGAAVDDESPVYRNRCFAVEALNGENGMRLAEDIGLDGIFAAPLQKYLRLVCHGRDVITSYSIHYTKLYEGNPVGPRRNFGNLRNGGIRILPDRTGQMVGWQSETDTPASLPHVGAAG